MLTQSFNADFIDDEYAIHWSTEHVLCFFYHFFFYCQVEKPLQRSHGFLLDLLAALAIPHFPSVISRVARSRKCILRLQLRVQSIWCLNIPRAWEPPVPSVRRTRDLAVITKPVINATTVFITHNTSCNCDVF